MANLTPSEGKQYSIETFTIFFYFQKKKKTDHHTASFFQRQLWKKGTLDAMERVRKPLDKSR